MKSRPHAGHCGSSSVDSLLLTLRCFRRGGVSASASANPSSRRDVLRADRKLFSTLSSDSGLPVFGSSDLGLLLSKLLLVKQSCG